MSTREECFFCRVERPKNQLERKTFREIRGGTEEVPICESCMNVPAVEDRLLYGANGQLMLMINTKLDLLLRKLK